MFNLKEFDVNKFGKYTPKEINYVFQFGKYKGQLLEKVLNEHPSYINWQISNNIYFSISYEVLDIYLSDFINSQNDNIIFLTTIKNEFANRDCKLYFNYFPEEIQSELYGEIFCDDWADSEQRMFEEEMDESLYEEFDGEMDLLGGNID